MSTKPSGQLTANRVEWYVKKQHCVGSQRDSTLRERYTAGFITSDG